MKPTFASLFCGCGGFDLGFLDAGFRCVAAFDNDPFAVGIHRLNLSSRPDLVDLSDRKLRLPELKGVDVLLAGPPCQGFSTVGKRDPRDSRNRLLVRSGELAIQAKAKFLVVENVPGVLAGKQRRFWRQLVSMLQGADYHTIELRCEAQRMGVAQARKRVVLLAAAKCGMLPRYNDKSPPSATLRDVLDDIGGAPDHVPRHLEAGTKSALIAKRISPGQKLCNVREGPRAVHTWDIPEVYGRTTKWERTVLEALLRRRRQRRIRDFGDADPVTGHALRQYLNRSVADTLRRLKEKGFIRRIDGKYDLTHTFNGKFRRLRWDEPAPTVDSRFGDPWYFLHPEEDRGFTVREAARIQGFPDWFRFGESSKRSYRVIGNAVPPSVARILALSLRKCLLS